MYTDCLHQQLAASDATLTQDHKPLIMDEDCPLCPSSLFYYKHSESEPTGQERHELFHRPCPACSLAMSQEESICDFCQHLRLKHLIRCVKPETRMGFLFPLRKGLAEDYIVSKCPLCRIVNHMIVVGLIAGQLSEIKGTNYDIILYLGPSQDPQSGASSILSADIYASYSEGDGISNIWVGDLHITDINKSKA